MDFAKYGKEKRYNLFPELLDRHVERMQAAHERANQYLKKTALLHMGLVRYENFLGDPEGITEQIMRCTIKDGKKDSTLLCNQPKESPAYRAKDKIWEAVRPVFQEGVMKRLERLFSEHTYLQHLKNEPIDSDDQKVFHSDTFFPCVKFWYFPHKVEVDDGPFWYVPFSTVLTENLLDWHRQRVKDLKEWKAEEWRGRGHQEGSFRISPEEIKALGLESIPVCVEADTLVIANVFGFHKRGDVKEVRHRCSIHGSIRFDPFS